MPVRVHRWIDFAGSMALLACIIHVCLSWFLAAGHAHAPSGGANSKVYFSELANTLSWLPSSLKEILRTGGPFTDWPTLALSYSIPIGIQTICAVIALWAIKSATSEIDERALVRRAFFWAAGFAIVSAAAFNVMTSDIWLSIPWGRTVLDGQDPYLVAFSPATVIGTPLDYSSITMTYGPLWAIVSTLTVFISGDSATLTWMLLKVVLLVAWLVVLLGVRDISSQLSLKRQAYAMILVGWLPVGFHNIVAEGHNDGFMIALFLLWLNWMCKPGVAAPLAFLGATISKFIVAPVVIVDAIYFLRTRSFTLKQYFMRALPSIFIAVPVMVFLLTNDRLSQMQDMRHWHFLAPSDLLFAVELATGINLPAVWIPRLCFGAIALWSLYQLWVAPSIEHVWVASLCILAALLFAGVGHVWPWFYVWVLPLAALVPGNLMARFVIGACIVAPFSILRVMFSDYLGDGGAIALSLLVYMSAFGLLAFTILERRAANAREKTTPPTPSAT